MAFYRAVGRIITEAKQDHGGISRLSDFVGVPVSTINKWRAGIYEPPHKDQIEFLKKAARYLSNEKKERERLNKLIHEA